MGRMAELLWRAPVLLAAASSLAWSAPSFLRSQAGIVVLETTPITVSSAPDTVEAVDIDVILDAALFGRAAQEQAAANPVAKGRPDLALRGIFASGPKGSTALLKVDGETGLYRQGMEVVPGLELTTIEKTLVTLEDADGVITLHFDDTVVAAKAEDVPETPSPDTLLARMGNGLVVPARYEKPGKPETTAEYIDYWRHRIKENPQRVLDEIGLKPTEQGYVIADSHDVGVRLAGLRSGDLVRSVNGRTVGDPDADRRFYDVIAGEGFARLEVERDGKILSFSFPLR